MSTGKGSNWHKLVIQANLYGWQSSPQEGPGTESTHFSVLVCGRTSPSGCQPGASLPISKSWWRQPTITFLLGDKATGQPISDDFKAHWFLIISLRILGIRPTIQLKDAHVLSLMGCLAVLYHGEKSSPHTANQKYPALETMKGFGTDGLGEVQLSTQPTQCIPRLAAEHTSVRSYWRWGCPTASTLLLIQPCELLSNQDTVLLSLSLGYKHNWP